MVKESTTEKAKAAPKKASSSKSAASDKVVGTGNTPGRGRAKTREGTVVSNKMAKTVVVAVTRLEQHPIYKKYVHKTKRYYAHDEKQECNSGDLVRIIETRPLSKLKRWRVAEIVRRAEVGLDLPADASGASK